MALIPLRVWIAGAAVLALLLGGWWAIDTYGDRREAEGRADVQEQWKQARAAQTREAAARDAEYRKREAVMLAETQEAQRARETERADARRAAAGMRTELDLLRDGARAYAATGSATPEAPAASSGDRAANLAAALDDALRTHEASTAAAVDVAADLRAVLRAWPTDAVTPRSPP